MVIKLQVMVTSLELDGIVWEVAKGNFWGDRNTQYIDPGGHFIDVYTHKTYSAENLRWVCFVFFSSVKHLKTKTVIRLTMQYNMCDIQYWHGADSQ